MKVLVTGATGPFGRAVSRRLAAAGHEVTAMARRVPADPVGLRRALLVGHSMGGRTVMEVAARDPALTLAATLIDAAAGDSFDESRERVKSPVKLTTGLLSAAMDTLIDRVGLRPTGTVRHVRMLAGAGLANATHPAQFMSVARAIATADRTGDKLRALRENGIPTAVIHGEQDLVVPMSAAIGAADASGATLVTLPAAYHSWVLPSPWTFTQILSQLIVDRRLGDELTDGLAAALADPDDPVLRERYYADGAPVLDMVPPTQIIGVAEPRRARHYHHYRIRPPAPPR